MYRYVFKQYDPVYPKLFAREKGRLQKLLGKDVFIEHIGSTAVPGMRGKGIIDIAIAGSSIEELPNISSKLIEAGYYYDPDDGTDERWFHGRKVSDEERYHVHLTFKESRDWIEMISFRDYLKTHPKDFKRYEEIKKRGVKVADQDKDIYMKTKEPLIAEIIKEATRSKF